MKFIDNIFKIIKSEVSWNKDHLFFIYDSNILIEKEKKIELQILTILFKTIEYSLILTFYKTITKTIKRLILENFLLILYRV